MLRSVRAAALVVVLLGGILTAWSPSAACADHVVRVRAETRIELDVRRGPELEVRGVLRDDAGHPVASRRVDVAIRPEHGAVSASRGITTEPDGTFAMTAPSPGGVVVVDAVFLGEPDLEASNVRIVVDEQRAHVVLVVTLRDGSRLSLDEPTHPLTVTATSSAGGAGLHLTVRNEIGTEIAAGTTDDSGRWDVDLASSLLGPAAAGRLVARSEADATRAAAQTEVPIVRSRSTRLTWLDTTTEILDGTVLRGRLDTSAAPLERHAVGVFLDGQHLGTRLTGPGGEFSIPLEPSVSRGAVSVRVEARFDADAPWLESSASLPRTLTVTTPQRTLPWLAAASALFFLGLGGWLRRRPIDVAQARESRAPGVMAARPTGLLPSVRGIAGRVVHNTSGDAIGAATLTIGSLRAETDREGRFEITPPDGAYTLVAEAAGFEAVQHRIQSPHRGEWRGFTIRMASRRDLASDVLLDVLSLVLPNEVASTATDRELLAIARRRGSSVPEMEALVRAVEQIVYGEAPPDGPELERVRALATTVRGKLARVDSASAASL